MSVSQKYLLAPRKQSVNLLKQLVEDGPSSMSDYERRKGEKSVERSAPLQLQLCASFGARKISTKQKQIIIKKKLIKRKTKLFQDAMGSLMLEAVHC